MAIMTQNITRIINTNENKGTAIKGSRTKEKKLDMKE